MPKKVKPKATGKPRRKKSSRGNQGLGLYIIAGIICVAAVWYITKPVATDKESARSGIESSKDRPDRSKVKDTRKAEKPLGDPVAPQDLNLVIESALKEMDITDSIYKRRKKGGATIYSAPLDPNTYDLFFANMVLKGRVEKAGGKLESAVESGKMHVLSFSLPGQDKKCNVELYYDAKPYSSKAVAKTLAIVVDDFGEIGGDLLNGFLNLPKEVSFAIFPEMKNSLTTMERAHAQGRETIIHVPMEPLDYPRVNPGKNAILVNMKHAEISRLVNRFVDQMPLCIGINNHMGSLATTDPDVMGSVMGVLKEHNKLFLDSRTSNVSVAYQVAQKAHLRAFRNDIFLDSPDISSATMDSKISQLETMSAGDPHLIAITHCHNQEKLVYLVRFIDRMRKAGYTLVPLSQSGKYKVPAIL